MPTIVRLVSAILFTAIGWFTAGLVVPLLPDGTAVGRFGPISAVLGFLVGWFFTGKRLGRDASGGFGIGLTSSLVLLFWVLLVFSGYKMLQISMRSSQFDGPMEALQGLFGIAAEYLWLIATPEVTGTLILGGLAIGWIIELIAKRWG